MSGEHGKSVLCIGNEPVSLNFRCAQLRKNGWTVLSSGHGHEGVLRFQREPVDAVVIDLNDTGSEAALIIGALKKQRPDVPIVMLVTDEEKLTPGATNQADAVLRKSEESGRLLDVLSGLTQRH
jgi:CheY-like chemotaxis protein